MSTRLELLYMFVLACFLGSWFIAGTLSRHKYISICYKTPISIKRYEEKKGEKITKGHCLGPLSSPLPSKNYFVPLTIQ